MTFARKMKPPQRLKERQVRASYRGKGFGSEGEGCCTYVEEHFGAVMRACAQSNYVLTRHRAAEDVAVEVTYT